MYKIARFSVFLHVENHVFEISVSKKISISLRDENPVAEALMVITHFQKKDWKKWLFFVLEVIQDNDFQIRSFIVFKENQNLREIFDNQYSLNLDIKHKTANVRLEKDEIKKFLAKLNGIKRNYSLADNIEYNPPISDRIVDQGLRTIELNIIEKVHCMIAPTPLEIQMYLLTWNKNKESPQEQDRQILNTLDISKPIIPFAKIPQIEQERNLELEQPFGLFCRGCGMEYAPNLYATECTTCFEKLFPR